MGAPLGAPFAGPDTPVRPEWMDANGHMNLAYYVVVFDLATDALFDALDLGHAYRERTGRALFAVEAHTLYARELCLGQIARVRARLLGADGKRLHLAHEMFEAEACCAMQELMFLHMDLATRRACPFPPDVAARVAAAMASHAGLPRPEWVGRRVGLPRGASSVTAPGGPV